MIEIKQATMEMLDDICALEELVWKDDSATRESMMKRIEIFPEGFCASYENNVLVGMANSAILPIDHNVEEYDQAFFPWERIHEPGGEILYLFCSTVHPDFRGQGIWKKMLNFRVNYAKNHPEIKNVWVTGRTTESEYGPDTATLMERFGFKKVKKFPFNGHNTQALLELNRPYNLEIT